jgi:hypothetical protein
MRTREGDGVPTVDLEVLRVSPVDVELRDGRRTGVECLETEERRLDGDSDILEVEWSDRGGSQRCRGKSIGRRPPHER